MNTDWDYDAPWCICGEDWRRRGMLDLRCRHDEFEEWDEECDRLRRELEKAKAEQDRLRGVVAHLAESVVDAVRTSLGLEES